MNADLQHINLMSRNMDDLDTHTAWFESQSTDEQRAMLQGLGLMVFQAHPHATHLDKAVSLSGLRPTHTPCVLLARQLNQHGVAATVGLHAAEWPRVFRILLSLFHVADAHRRATTCKNGCAHWWHHDMDDGTR